MPYNYNAIFPIILVLPLLYLYFVQATLESIIGLTSPGAPSIIGTFTVFFGLGGGLLFCIINCATILLIRLGATRRNARLIKVPPGSGTGCEAAYRNPTRAHGSFNCNPNEYIVSDAQVITSHLYLGPHLPERWGGGLFGTHLMLTTNIVLCFFLVQSDPITFQFNLLYLRSLQIGVG